jgi:hypothetical protein
MLNNCTPKSAHISQKKQSEALNLSVIQETMHWMYLKTTYILEGKAAKFIWIHYIKQFLKRGLFDTIHAFILIIAVLPLKTRVTEQVINDYSTNSQKSDPIIFPLKNV